MLWHQNSGAKSLPLNSGAMTFLVPNSILLTWHHFWSLAPKVWHHDSLCSKRLSKMRQEISQDDESVLMQCIRNECNFDHYVDVSSCCWGFLLVILVVWIIMESKGGRSGGDDSVRVNASNLVCDVFMSIRKRGSKKVDLSNVVLAGQHTLPKSAFRALQDDKLALWFKLFYAFELGNLSNANCYE
ncbi:hypothetical protein Tco_1143884 [Tanacetum coccineum]